MSDEGLLLFIKTKSLGASNNFGTEHKVEQKCKISGSKGQAEVIAPDALKDECTT